MGRREIRGPLDDDSWWEALVQTVRADGIHLDEQRLERLRPSPGQTGRPRDLLRDAARQLNLRLKLIDSQGGIDEIGADRVETTRPILDVLHLGGWHYLGTEPVPGGEAIPASGPVPADDLYDPPAGSDDETRAAAGEPVDSPLVPPASPAATES